MRLRTQLFLGYLLVFTLMVLIVGVSVNGFKSQSDTARWVAHTQRVIGQAHKVEKLLSDLETGQRGFLITGDEEFLEPYKVSGVPTERSDLDCDRGELSPNPGPNPEVPRHD